MGNVGQADGIKATFKRIQRKVAGGDVSTANSDYDESLRNRFNFELKVLEREAF